MAITANSLTLRIIQVFIQCYSIISTQVYRTPPRFFLGHGVSLGLYALGMIATAVLVVICKKSNKKKEERRAAFEARGEVDPDMSKSFEELCDFHPAYMYTL